MHWPNSLKQRLPTPFLVPCEGWGGRYSLFRVTLASSHLNRITHADIPQHSSRSQSIHDGTGVDSCTGQTLSNKDSRPLFCSFLVESHYVFDLSHRHSLRWHRLLLPLRWTGHDTEGCGGLASRFARNRIRRTAVPHAEGCRPPIPRKRRIVAGFPSESVAGFRRNGWPTCVGISGRDGSEYATSREPGIKLLVNILGLVR